MSQPGFDEYVTRIEEQAAWYDTKAKWNQRRCRLLKGMAIVFSVLTPLLLAVNLALVPPPCTPVGLVATLLPIGVSVLASGSVAMLATFRYQERWLGYRRTCETLRRQLVLFAHRIGHYEDADAAERLFVDRVEAILAAETTGWLSSERSDSDHPPGTDIS